MLEIVETVYQNGVFIPEKTFDLPEGARVKIVVETLIHENQTLASISESANSSSPLHEPIVTDAEKRKEVFAQLFKIWDENPIPANAPQKFTRE